MRKCWSTYVSGDIFLGSYAVLYQQINLFKSIPQCNIDQRTYETANRDVSVCVCTSKVDKKLLI